MEEGANKLNLVKLRILVSSASGVLTNKPVNILTTPCQQQYSLKIHFCTAENSDIIDYAVTIDNHLINWHTTYKGRSESYNGLYIVASILERISRKYGSLNDAAKHLKKVNMKSLQFGTLHVFFQFDCIATFVKKMTKWIQM